MTKTAVITGASSGIGAATARALSDAGYHVVLGARRFERIEKLAHELGGTALPLDVRDPDSVAAFAQAIDKVDVLVNNAGGALGAEPIHLADIDHWKTMWETNVLGTLQVTKSLLDKIIASTDGLIITVTSIAALETYDNGGGYTSAKHAQSALHRTLRGELLGKPVRFTEICPGAAETEFSLVRFDGDADKAAKVYEGMTPLLAEDIAHIIAYTTTLPSRVNIDRIVVKPRDQHSVQRIHRNSAKD